MPPVPRAPLSPTPFRGRRNRADEAPTEAEERASAGSLRPAPLVRQRLRELGYEGRLVCGWTPPVLSLQARFS